jgi:hypothetical protein
VTETSGLQTMDATQTTQTTEHARLGDRIMAVLQAKSAQVQASATKPRSRATSKWGTAMQVEELDRELGVNMYQIDGVLCRLHRDERVQGFNVNLVTQPR